MELIGVSRSAIDEGLQDLGLPVPIQTFLWRQISPFTRPKLGKLHEASCMELKEACKSFEKVLVQNILFGLSPSLSSALKSVPRWRVVQAALPHVMHCAGSLLHNRVKDLQNLGAAETKLLYTLHWILLDAAEECADADSERQEGPPSPQHYLFSIPTVALFVYLFAPIAHHLKESDFQNFRLENGLKLWHGLWEYRSPSAPCFTALCKPRPRPLTGSRSSRQLDNVYPGRKPSGTSTDQVGVESPPSTSVSDQGAAGRQEDEGNWVSSPKDSVFPETIPEEASSVEEERVVIFRLPATSQQGDPSIYTADASLFQFPVNRKQTKVITADVIEPKIKVTRPPMQKGASSSTEKDSLESNGRQSQSNSTADVSAATFLDVAVLRCLFISHWQEEGIYWALHYLFNRLRDLSEETVPPSQPRRRSNSLPIPHIEVSLYQGPGNQSTGSQSDGTNKDFIEVPEPQISSLLAESPYVPRSLAECSTMVRRASEKKRRAKLADLRAFVETKLLSKSERALEKIDFDAPSVVQPLRFEQIEYHRSLDTGEEHLSRAGSLLTRVSSTNLVKGKSMPSLSCLLDTGYIGETPRNTRPTTITRLPTVPRNPIITVTEHTPAPSPDYLRRQGSVDSQLDVISSGATTSGGWRGGMARSQTDSHISYVGVEEQEAPGSAAFITKEGNIDLQVVFQAVYSVTKRDPSCCSMRVLEVVLNLCELLLDLGALKHGAPAHKLAMGVVERSLRQLGCPHGCGEGLRGPPAEFLRTQCNAILARMLRAAPGLSRAYLRQLVSDRPLPDVLEFFHSFVGFCVDPSSLLSPLNQKRSSSKSPDLGGAGGQGGYATNFGGGSTGGVESQVIVACFKTLVSRFVTSAKELKTPENMSLYCDVRQLVTYVKGAHGGPFRRVALSGLIGAAPRPNKKPQEFVTTRVIRHLQYCDPLYAEERAARKLLFKKRSTSSTCASLLETEGGEDTSRISQSPLGNIRRKTRPLLTPRQSERALLGETTAQSIDRPSQISRFSEIVRWFRRRPRGRQALSDMSDSPSDSSGFGRQGSIQLAASRRAGEGLGRSLQRARRRVERRLGRMGLGKGKKKTGGPEEVPGSYLSRRSSMETGEGARDTEVVVLKERRLVALEPVKLGMERLGFLLETCAPGTVPDPQLLSAALDLPQSPVISRATLLLECAYFVHCCNRGQWPPWMKLNLPAFRPSGPSLAARGPPAPGIRRTHMLQRSAGKMFFHWAEALGNRLEELVAADKQQAATVATSVNDPERQKYFLQQDEEEDFLDEASVNPRGSDCPPALRLVACMLLLEITSFLRETYQTLPKSNRMSARERPAPWERVYREANRRWSMALSSMGHSQTSAQSLQSIAGADTGAQTERKISFVLHEPDNESEGSSNTTVTLQGEEGQGPSRRPTAPPVRPFLLRRGTGGAATGPGGGSFKRRSLKLRRPPQTKDPKEPEPECAVNRTDSIQSKRKVSSLSDRSDTSEAGIASGGEESPGILSDEQPPESPSDSNDTDETGKNLPWLRAVVEVINSFNFYCGHQGFCHPYCYRRHMRAATRLILAVRKVYGEEMGIGPFNLNSYDPTRQVFRRDRYRTRKPSEQTGSGQVSPARRKDSTTRRDRLSDPDLPPLANFAMYKEEEKIFDPPPVLKYIKSQVRELFHCPMAALVKGAAVMQEEHFNDSLPAAWELLLESNQETAASAAALFILGSVKAPTTASEIMQRHLKHRDPGVRISAILRFQVLWKLRYQVWPRMEEGAHLSFKVPPPGIEFTLPSPKIGIESLPVVDPPWSPRAKTKDMEVTLNQERHRSLVTATKTRKKQQTEAIKQALMQQEAKRRAERQSFLLTTIPITVQAAHEPGLDHAPAEDHAEAAGDEEGLDGPRSTAPHLHAAHSLFPSCLCSAVVQIVGLLDDAAVCSDGTAVYEVAYQVIWSCLVEDSALFLRYVLERLTRDKQEAMFKLLRHLIRFIPRLPQQAAFALYNYIIGYVMFYVRSPHEGGQQLVGTALSILWMVVHSVHGIMFKDLKQILRKEQCDASILLTANVPSAKKMVVHGPQDREEGGIPSQFPVQEDTQFFQILKESLDFFGIEESVHREHFLIDYKTHQIHNPHAYVRDFYFFKRSTYPQVGLVRMKQSEAFIALQRQELLKKFVEIGKVHLTWAILKNVDMVVQRVVFLHEELMKLPSFPRKALEAALELYKGGEIGKELLGLDVLHKFMWVRLIARMFEAMAGNFAYSGDIQLFLNVLNGAALLHTEDSCILRYVMATYVNAAFNFKNIFSTNGYLLIMPTLLQIYSHHQTNKLLTTTVEYAVKQFYLMNRKPFILQMFGSVSAILDTDEESSYGDAHKVQSSCLFNLLLSLETPSPDPLNIAELVKESKPLQAIDFCYHDESEMVTVLDCISLCVMVVSYSAESRRGYQMLIILEAILPCYIRQIQLPTYYREGKSERDIILQLAVSVRTLVNNCEGLSKSYNGPYRNSPEHKGSSQRNCSRGPPCSPGLDFEEESHSKYMSDIGRQKGMMESGGEDSELVRAEYRRPRDVLLSLVGEFMSRASARMTELSKKQGASESKPVDLLDVRSHVRLAEIAHSLLKVSPYDPESMGCRGLQRYMSCVLPRADWLDITIKTALGTILRRLDKVFNKISKKPSIRRNTDWEAAAGLLKGIHETLVRYPYVMHWQQVRALLNTCQALIVSEQGSTSEGVSSAGAALMSQPPPPHFCSTVVRLVALQVVSPGECYSLEQVCGGSAEFPTQEKAEGALMNLLMPLCLRVGSGRGDVAELRQNDCTFLVTAVLNAMSPPGGRSGQTASQSARSGVDNRAGSLTFTGSREAKRPARVSGSLYQAAFLALRVLCVCFEQRLSNEWPRVARVMRDLGRRNEAAPELWSFLEFVVTHRTPLYILLQPFILHKISQPPIGDHERHMQFLIRERMRGTPPSSGKSKGALLLDLARELRELKDELDEKRYEHEPPEPPRKQAETIQPGPPPAECGRHQRPSLISLLTGVEHRGGACTPSDTLSQSLPPPRESLSSSSTGNQQGHVSISECPSPCAPSRTQIHSEVSQSTPFVVTHPGETSTTPLSPDSPADDSSGELQRPRLQRSKAQSRKTFRLRRGRPNHNEVGHAPLENEPLPNRPDLSWDSVSQTSSTSGYRDSCSLQGTLISPEGSLNEERRMGSHHSLLMVFETQDEDTLI